MCHGARHSSAGRLTAEEVFYYNKNVTLYLYSVFFFFVCFANQPAVIWTELKVTVLRGFFCLVILFLKILLSGGLHSWKTKVI